MPTIKTKRSYIKSDREELGVEGGEIVLIILYEKRICG